MESFQHGGFLLCAGCMAREWAHTFPVTNDPGNECSCGHRRYFLSPEQMREKEVRMWRHFGERVRRERFERALPTEREAIACLNWSNR